MAALVYGGGLRLLECLRLRVKDVDFQYRQLVIRDAKGQKDRITLLPQNLFEPLRNHLARVRALHESDLREGLGGVHLPFALAQKYPTAERDWDDDDLHARTESRRQGSCQSVRKHRLMVTSGLQSWRRTVHSSPFCRNAECKIPLRGSARASLV